MSLRNTLVRRADNVGRERPNDGYASVVDQRLCPSETGVAAQAPVGTSSVDGLFVDCNGSRIPPEQPEEVRETDLPNMSASSLMLKLQSTVDLVARVRGGDQEALEIICFRCLKALNRFAVGRLPQRLRGMLETQDLVAEALEKGLRHLEEIDLGREGALMSYLRRVLKNLIIDKIRAIDRRPAAVSLDDNYADAALSPLEKVLTHEKLEIYEEALEHLKPRDAAAIILRFEEQTAYDEIAIQLGFATANAARVTVRRAVVRLTHEMARLRRAKHGQGIDGGTA